MSDFYVFNLPENRSFERVLPKIAVHLISKMRCAASSLNTPTLHVPFQRLLASQDLVQLTTSGATSPDVGTKTPQETASVI